LWFNLACACLSFGQSTHVFTFEEKLAPQDVPAGVKAISVLVSRPGLFKMQPFELEAEFYYDEQTRLIKHFTYLIDNSMWGKMVATSFQEYAYNEQGKLKEHYREGYNGNFWSLTGYEYDAEGRMSDIIHYYPDRTIRRRQPVGRPSAENPLQASVPQNQITYDTLMNGYLASIESPKGEVLTERRVLLNANQQVAHVITTDHKQQNVSIINYQYDSEGKEVEQEVLDKKGNVVLKYNYTYSVSGFLMQTTVRGKKEKIQKIIKYEYEFW